MVAVVCVRITSSVCTHKSDNVVMHAVAEGGIFEFIGRGHMKKGIFLCDLRQDWFEFVTMYKNQMTHVNVIKNILWEVIELCAIFGRKRLFSQVSASF